MAGRTPSESSWGEFASFYLNAGASMLELAAEGIGSLESMLDRAGTRDGLLDSLLGDGAKDDELDAPLDPSSTGGKRLLAGLQANILRAHGRDHAMHLLVSFGEPPDETSHAASVDRIRAWIGYMEETHVTTAAGQREDRVRAKAEGKKSDMTIAMLLLSSRGYEFLGERRPRDGAFREGMRERAHRLGDPAFEEWEEKYRHEAEQIHALVIVGAKDGAALDGVRQAIEEKLKLAGGSILVDERGRQKRDPESGRAIEHFGYADGVSQPQLIDGGEPGAALAKRYDQRAPLKLVLQKDRQGDGYGSFLVYRKLEQNVKSFEAAVERVAGKLGESAETVGAMAIGRFKNGTPLAIQGSAKPGYDPRHDEDFDYEDDEDGGKCPLHAHIRKANPRGSVGFMINLLAREQSRRIARRGITYADSQSKSVGLLFMCFQSDIRDQFEFLQRSWANNPDFIRIGTGLDPATGQKRGRRTARDSPHWPKGYESDKRERISFGQHVRLLGGEYFFAPSVDGLKALARPDRRSA